MAFLAQKCHLRSSANVKCLSEADQKIGDFRSVREPIFLLIMLLVEPVVSLKGIQVVLSETAATSIRQQVFELLPWSSIGLPLSHQI